MQLAYLSGFFDGEGCVHFRNRGTRWICYLSLTNTVREPLEIAQTLFGGKIYGSPKKDSNYIVWQWNVSGSASEVAACALLKFTVAKREQLCMYLRARQTFYGAGVRVSPETKRERETCAERLKVLRCPVR